MRKKCKLVALLVVVCMVVTLLPIVPVEEYEASEKVSAELLELLDVTYEDLTAGNYVDSGETYSCIIWIQDVDVEEAVEAGIDAAEMTRTDYSVWSRYDYPYTTYEANGLTYVDVDFDDNESDEYVQAYIETEREKAVELYSDNNNSFVAENFMARDMSVTYVSKYSPSIFANLSVSKIADLILKDEIVSIELWKEPETETDATGATLSITEIQEKMELIRADYAKEYFVVTGDGVKIGQIELELPDTNTVQKNHENQNIAFPDSHPDNVHLIMSTIAPDATYYATGVDEGVSEGTFYEQIEWLLSQGVNIINMSMGYLSYNNYDTMSRWVDHIAYNHDVHFVKSAGNSITEGVTSPGMAYNIITVGVVSNAGIRVTEVIEGKLRGSSYNLAGVSREKYRTSKPDIMAPGYYSNRWGTSYAAPVVAGTIALMCEYQPSLKVKQHIVKAVLAATTAKTTLDAHYVNTDTYFDEYGAGVIDVQSALYAVYKRHYSTSTGTLTNVGDTISYNMTVTSSDTCMRIAIAHANRIEFGANIEHTKLNTPVGGMIGVIGMKVYNPGGTVVVDTFSQSYIDGINLQVIEFDPRETGGAGTYRIEVILKTAAENNRATNFGVAWR